MRRIAAIAALLILAACSSIPDKPEGRGWVRATITHVVDGDTLKFQHPLVAQTCRMTGYNAPEMHGAEAPEGQVAKDKLAEMVLERQAIVLWRDHTDRYGRWLCIVLLDDGTNVNTAMRKWLEARGYDGVGKYDYLEERDRRAEIRR